MMARLKLTVWISGTIPVACILPAVLLKIGGAGVPKLFATLAAIGMATIPVPVTLFLVYFNSVWGRLLGEAIRAANWGGIARTSVILCFCNLLLIYVLVSVMRAVWLN